MTHNPGIIVLKFHKTTLVFILSSDLPYFFIQSHVKFINIFILNFDIRVCQNG